MDNQTDYLSSHTRFGYCRRRGILAQKFNRRTNVEPCTNAQSKPFSPAFGNTLLSAAPFSVALVVGRLSVGKKYTLLQALVCVLALCGLQMCVLLCGGFYALPLFSLRLDNFFQMLCAKSISFCVNP
jgi:hypothetical protein